MDSFVEYNAITVFKRSLLLISVAAISFLGAQVQWFTPYKIILYILGWGTVSFAGISLILFICMMLFNKQYLADLEKYKTNHPDDTLLQLTNKQAFELLIRGSVIDTTGKQIFRQRSKVSRIKPEEQRLIENIEQVLED